MRQNKTDEIVSYIKDKNLFKQMRVDLLRSSIMGFMLLCIFLAFVFAFRNQNNGLHTELFLLSGLFGLAIILYKPGRPVLTGRNTFGFPKELTDYEKKLEAVILLLRKRNIVILATLPYFFLLFYFILTNETSPKKDLSFLLFSCFLSFFLTLALAGSIQYLQIWWSLGKKHKKLIT
jgi:hypothetical protein